MDNPVHDGICLRPSAQPVMPFIKDEDLTVPDPFPVFCKLPEVVALVLKVTHQVRHPDIQNPVSLSAWALLLRETDKRHTAVCGFGCGGQAVYRRGRIHRFLKFKACGAGRHERNRIVNGDSVDS